MLPLILVLNILNICGLITAGILYFKEKYTIVSIEQWNEIATVYNIAITSGIINEKGKINESAVIPNVGFFKEQLKEIEEEEEEDD